MPTQAFRSEFPFKSGSHRVDVRQSLSHPMPMPAPAGATAPLVPVPTDKLERIPDGFDQMLAELESAGIIHPTSHDQGDHQDDLCQER